MAQEKTHPPTIEGFDIRQRRIIGMTFLVLGYNGLLKKKLARLQNANPQPRRFE